MNLDEDGGRLGGFPTPLVEGAVTGPDGIEALDRRLAGARAVVAIVGSSISGLVLAARLGAAATSDRDLAVVLVTGAAPIRRRLVAGCSLRWSTVRRMARALGSDESNLLERLGGAGARFGRLAVARAEPGSRPPRLVPRRMDATARPFVGLSTRHGAILDALRASLDPHLDVVLLDGDVPRDAGFAGGTLPLVLGGEKVSLTLPEGRTVVLNATTQADLLRPGRSCPAPDRYVCAVQAPLVPVREPPGCGNDVGYAPMTFGPPAPHLAFFTPFRDADTPAATWYGINTMVVPAAVIADGGADAALSGVWDRLEELEEHLGFAEVDPDETRGGAVVPVVHDRGVRTEGFLGNGSPVVDAHRAFTSGAPAINVDGMLAATVGADAFATAFLAASGTPPLAAARAALASADRALLPVRARNRVNEWAFFRSPEPFRAAAARMPRLAWQAFTTDWARLRSR